MWHNSFQGHRYRQVFPRAILHIVGPRNLCDTRFTGTRSGVSRLFEQERSGAAEKLESFFRQASLFVMPSLNESYGIAPLEAMLHEMPALVSGRWALTELVTPERGAHCHPGDRNSLIESLLKMLANPDHLVQMVQAGRRYVPAAHSWENVVTRMLTAMHTSDKT